MLEIPEAQTLAQQLDDAIIGKEIAAVAAAQSPHGFAWYFGDPALYPHMLNGRRVDGAMAQAGHVELTLGEMRLLFQDGVNARLLSPEDKPPKKHQLYVEFTDGYKLVCTVQMYGALMAFPAGAHDDNFYYTVAKQKPSPLTDAFNEAYFAALLDNPKLSAKAFLATEQRIPGLGNGCLQDILFHARIHPQRKMSSLSDVELSTLCASVKQTLLAMARLGGRDTEKDLYGKPGGYRTLLSGKTLAYPCPNCGGGITRKAYLGGTIYFCPTCQPV